MTRLAQAGYLFTRGGLPASDEEPKHHHEFPGFQPGYGDKAFAYCTNVSNGDRAITGDHNGAWRAMVGSDWGGPNLLDMAPRLIL